jgi:hypothetical protein
MASFFCVFTHGPTNCGAIRRIVFPNTTEDPRPTMRAATGSCADQTWRQLREEPRPPRVSAPAASTCRLRAPGKPASRCPVQWSPSPSWPLLLVESLTTHLTRRVHPVRSARLGDKSSQESPRRVSWITRIVKLEQFVKNQKRNRFQLLNNCDHFVSCE